MAWWAARSLTIDGVEVTRRIHPSTWKRADGSVSMGIYQPDNYLSLVLDDTVTLKHYYVRDGSDTVVAQQLPSGTDLRPDGPGQGRQQGRDRLCDPARPGRDRAHAGLARGGQPLGLGWWGNQNLTFYQYTETTTGGAARYGN